MCHDCWCIKNINVWRCFARRFWHFNMSNVQLGINEWKQLFNVFVGSKMHQLKGFPATLTFRNGRVVKIPDFPHPELAISQKYLFVIKNLHCGIHMVAALRIRGMGIFCLGYAKLLYLLRIPLNSTGICWYLLKTIALRIKNYFRVYIWGTRA